MHATTRSESERAVQSKPIASKCTARQSMACSLRLMRHSKVQGVRPIAEADNHRIRQARQACRSRPAKARAMGISRSEKRLGVCARRCACRWSGSSPATHVSEKACARRLRQQSCRPSTRSATAATLSMAALLSASSPCARNAPGGGAAGKVAATRRRSSSAREQPRASLKRMKLLGKVVFSTDFSREVEPDRLDSAHLRGGEHDLGLVPCVPGTKPY